MYVLLIVVWPLVHFLFWPLCCLFFFDIQILIVSLVSLNSFYLLIHYFAFQAIDYEQPDGRYTRKSSCTLNLIYYIFISSIDVVLKPYFGRIVREDRIIAHDQKWRDWKRAGLEPEVTEVCSAHAQSFPAFFFLSIVVHNVVR
jgi:hypothetical protein